MGGAAALIAIAIVAAGSIWVLRLIGTHAAAVARQAREAAAERGGIARNEAQAIQAEAEAELRSQGLLGGGEGGGERGGDAALVAGLIEALMAGPSLEGDAGEKARALVEQADARVGEGAFARDPAGEAAVCSALGRAWLKLGDRARAAERLRRAIDWRLNDSGGRGKGRGEGEGDGAELARDRAALRAAQER